MSSLFPSSREEREKSAVGYFSRGYCSTEEVAGLTGLPVGEVTLILEGLMSDVRNEVLLDTTVKDMDAPKRWKVNIGACAE